MVFPVDKVVFKERAIATLVGEHGTINVTYQNGQQRTIEVFRLLGAIEENRMQAEDWKSLHEDFQRITLKLILVRGIVAGEDLKLALDSFEDHWTLECRDLIQSFIDLERLPERTARREFVIASEKSGWLVQLRSYALELDGVIGQAEDPRIQIAKLLTALLRFERLSSRLLSYLDFRLQKVIKELDQAIAHARRDLTEPPSPTQPEPTS